MSTFTLNDTDVELTRDLCDYYNVTPQQALELGARKPGRKPDLPSSPTTHSVTGLTFEDIWNLKPRNSQEEIFQFYKDQGAWSSFRQVIRHKDLTHYHLNILSNIIRNDSVFCEYGCGIAPYTYTLLKYLDREAKLTIYITDVQSEHYTFGAWRARRLIENRNLKNVVLTQVPVLPNELPKFERLIDSITIFEVLEHVPSPINTVQNIFNQMNVNSLICENFIKHEHDGKDGPDLYSASLERNDYYSFMENNFTLLSGLPEKDSPNDTRLWIKK
jgi:hypothetical protein